MSNIFFKKFDIFSAPVAGIKKPPENSHFPGGRIDAPILRKNTHKRVCRAYAISKALMMPRAMPSAIFSW